MEEWLPVIHITSPEQPIAWWRVALSRERGHGCTETSAMLGKTVGLWSSSWSAQSWGGTCSALRNLRFALWQRGGRRMCGPRRTLRGCGSAVVVCRVQPRCVHIVPLSSVQEIKQYRMKWWCWCAASRATYTAGLTVVSLLVSLEGALPINGTKCLYVFKAFPLKAGSGCWQLGLSQLSNVLLISFAAQICATCAVFPQWQLSKLMK